MKRRMLVAMVLAMAVSLPGTGCRTEEDAREAELYRLLAQEPDNPALLLFFWDVLSLGGYLLLNAVIAGTSLNAERKSKAPPAWVKPLIFLSIPWAISIHTVTAFIYSGLGAKPF